LKISRLLDGTHSRFGPNTKNFEDLPLRHWNWTMFFARYCLVLLFLLALLVTTQFGDNPFGE